MIVYDVVQGSREWWALRLGMPTVSRFGQIITAKDLKPSTGRKNLIAALLVERVLQKPSDFREMDDDMVSGFGVDGTPWTRRGSDLEDEAARWYAAHRGVSVERIGFITNDEGTVGGSPDRKIVDPKHGDAGLEIKCRSAVNHMRMLLGYDDIAERAQVQGSLWLTGWTYWDSLAYNPDLPKRIDRHYPDRTFFREFDKAYAVFRKDFEAAEKMLAAIEEDVIEGDDLLARLRASLGEKEGTGKPLDMDEIDQLVNDVRECERRGILDDADVALIHADIDNGRWDDVRGMQAYVRRHLSLEVV